MGLQRVRHDWVAEQQQQHICATWHGREPVCVGDWCVWVTVPFPVTAVIRVAPPDSPADNGCSDAGSDKSSRPALRALE